MTHIFTTRPQCVKKCINYLYSQIVSHLNLKLNSNSNPNSNKTRHTCSQAKDSRSTKGLVVILRPVNVTTGEHIEAWTHVQTTLTIQFLILRIYCSSSPVLRSFVHRQTLVHAFTWGRSGAKSIPEPVTTRNHDASWSLQATFSNIFGVQQVTIIHPMYYIDHTSKTTKWYIILNNKFLYIFFKHPKGAVVFHVIHKIIIDFYPSASHCSWPLIGTSQWRSELISLSGIVFMKCTIRDKEVCKKIREILMMVFIYEH